MKYMYEKAALNHIYSTVSLRADDGDEDDDDQRVVAYQKKKAFQHFEHQLTFQQIHFYISKEISEPEDYAEMIHRMNTSSPADMIFIHLNTPGGSLDAGVQIINAMRNSPAKVVTILEGMAYSLGTMIFLAGDEMIVNDHCMMMFHAFKGTMEGKSHEVFAQVSATVKWFAIMSKKIYVPFLTDDEFKRLIAGEDFWMQSPEIRKRLNKMVKVLKGEDELKIPKTKTPRKKKETPTDS